MYNLVNLALLYSSSRFGIISALRWEYSLNKDDPPLTGIHSAGSNHPSTIPPLDRNRAVLE